MLYTIVKMSSEQKVNQIISDGHEIARLINDAKSVSDISNCLKKIEKYSTFIDEQFGIINAIDDEKESSLTTSLYVALKWKKESLLQENRENYTVKHLAKTYLQQFIEELDSQSWTKNYLQKVTSRP